MTLHMRPLGQAILGNQEVNSVSADKIGSLELCVITLSTQLGQPLSIGSLLENYGTSIDVSFAEKIKAVIATAERGGYHAALGKLALGDVNDTLLPSILFTKDEQALVVFSREGDTFKVLDPTGFSNQKGEPVTLDFAALEARVSGYALSLSKTSPAELHEPSIGKKSSWFRAALAENRWAYFQVILAAVVINSLALVTSLFTMVVYDRILPSGATESLFALTVGVSLALIFDFILKTLRSGFIDFAGRRADLKIGTKVFDQLLETKLGALSGSIGGITSSVRELDSLRDFFTSATMVALVDLPFVFIFVFAIFMLGGPLVIVPAIAVPSVLLIGLIVQPLLGRLSERMMSEGQIKQAVLVETLGGFEALKAASAGNFMRARWQEAMKRQSKFLIRTRTISQGATNATSFVQQAAQVLIVVYGAVLVISGEITSGVLIASVILTGRALAPLALVSQTLTRLHQARSSYRCVDALMKAPAERVPGRRFLSRPSLTGGVKFDNVSFCYPGQKKVALKDVDFEIKAGEHVAILGPVGSGKSTVARLLLGLYQPSEGAVLADGLDIQQIDPSDLRRNIGVALQEPWLVSGSIKDNIRLGSFQMSDEDILFAGNLAGVDAFTSRHPDGYEMQVGERGQGLSGGQKQAVALARALLGKPPILLFDEATSSMDIESEVAFISKLKSEAKGKTLIIITHRPSLLELVDRVVAIKDGQVIADGPKSRFTRKNQETGTRK